MAKLLDMRLYGSLKESTNYYLPVTQELISSLSGLLLAQKIFLSISITPKSCGEMSRELDIPEVYVDDLLRLLERALLVKRTSNDRFLANMLVMDKEESSKIIEAGKDLALTETQIIIEELDAYRKIIENTTFNSDNFCWDDMCYALIPGMIIDLGANESLHRKKIVFSPKKTEIDFFGQRIDLGTYLIWTVEGGWGAKRSFGVRIKSFSKGTIASVWSTSINRPELVFDDTDFDIIAHLKSGKTFNNLETTREKGRYLRMKHHNLINEDIPLLFTFPILHRMDIEKIDQAVIKICDRIVDSIFVAKKNVIDDYIRSITSKSPLRKPETAFCMIHRTIMDNCLDELVKNNILPEIPSKPAYNWSFWAYLDESALVKWHKI